MNPRHAAALALVGWYLMLPPALPDGKPNLEAPLSQWAQEDDFDSVNAYHKTRHDRRVLALKALDEIVQRMDSLPQHQA